MNSNTAETVSTCHIRSGGVRHRGTFFCDYSSVHFNLVFTVELINYVLHLKILTGNTVFMLTLKY